MPENRRTTTRLDPARPLVLDIHELGRRPGAMRRTSFSVAAPAGLGLDLIGVPEGARLELDLRLESVMEGVLVSGAVTAPLTGECARCLEPITDEVVVSLQELYAYPDSTTHDTTAEDEVSRLDGELLDLEPVLRDSVVLALPLRPLCREDCPGLCPTCGERLTDLPPGHAHEQWDPRWAALHQLYDSTETAPEGADRGADRDEET